jgi:hypothetical protein
VSEPPSSTTPPPVATGQVAAAPARLIGAEDAQRLASLLNLFADPLQARILYALDTVDERSLGDLAPVLQASADTGGRAANPSDHGADHRAPARSHGSPGWPTTSPAPLREHRLAGQWSRRVAPG